MKGMLVTRILTGEQYEIVSDPFNYSAGDFQGTRTSVILMNKNCEFDIVFIDDLCDEHEFHAWRKEEKED